MIQAQNIETLEPRIAPALIVATNGLSATFTDVDGDFVTIRASKPILDAGDFVTTQLGLGDQLLAILIGDDGPAADGVNLTITAVPKDVNDDGRPDGDGRVSIGHIDATGKNLGTVSVDGNLDQITAGSGPSTVPAIKMLNVFSMGEDLCTTGATSFTSEIDGDLGALKIQGNLRGITLTTLGEGKLGSITIAGSLIGIDGRGALISGGDMGAVQIGRDIIGSEVDDSIPGGYIRSLGKLKSVKVGGSLDAKAGAGAFISSFEPMGTVTIRGDVIGGLRPDSGAVFSNATIQQINIAGSLVGNRGGGQLHAAGKISGITIGGNILGGTQVEGVAVNSGKIYTTNGADIGNVTILGSIIGGNESRTGRIESDGALGIVKIGQNVEGGLGNESGSIFAKGRIAGVTIKGSLVGGVDHDTGSEPFTGVNSGAIRSDLSMGPVIIGGSLKGGSGTGSGSIRAEGRIDLVAIGGSVLGGAGAGSANIVAITSLGKITIGGDVVGGSEQESARIAVNQRIDSVTINGSLIGGNDAGADAQSRHTALLAAGELGKVRIGGSILGGNGPFSGLVSSSGDIASITVGGSVIGGAATGEAAPSGSGSIIASGNIGTVTVGGDLRGSDQFSGGTFDTGTVRGRHIGAVTIGGSVVAGLGFGGVFRSGTIVATDDIGSVTIRGDLRGQEENFAAIFARGQAQPTPTGDAAIGKITISGNVENAWIFAGVDANGVGVNGNAQVGAVSVGGDWIASSLASGCTSTDGSLGDANDAVIPGFGGDAIKAKIASIVIKGMVLGRPGTTATFGFLAEHIGSFKYSGTPVSLSPGDKNDTFALGDAIPLGPSRSPATADGFAVHVFEV